MKRKRKTRIFAIGYFGEGNFGDERIREYAAEAMKENGCEVRYLCGSGNFPRFSDAGAVPKRNPISVLRAIVWADAVVSPGGNLLQDETSRRSLLFYLLLFRTARLLGKKIFFLSSGFGGFVCRRSEKAVGRLLCASGMTGVRSAGDLRTVKRLCGHTVSVIRMPDLCFKSQNVSVNCDKTAFAVIPGKNGSFPENEVKSLSERTGLRAKYLVFHRREDVSKDGEKTVFCPATEEELFGLFGDCAFVLTARYHGAVYAFLAGIPCFADVRREKIRFFAEDHAPFCKPYPPGGIPAEELRAFPDAFDVKEAEKIRKKERAEAEAGLARFFALLPPRDGKSHPK